MINAKLLPALYLVPTPIGNLSDFSERSKTVLASVNRIFCEDTRVAGKMLKMIGIKNSRLESCNSFNEAIKAKHVVTHLQNNESIALISDAGQPLVSDPGYTVVNAVLKANLRVVPLAGPSAVMTALIASGFNAVNFWFKGFIGRGTNKRSKDIAQMSGFAHPIIIFESPLRVKKLLTEINFQDDNTEVCVAKELTKKHETFWRGKAKDLVEQFESIEPKGEFVVVIKHTLGWKKVSEAKLFQEIDFWRKKNTPLKKAVLITARIYNVNSNELYQKYLAANIKIT